ncbi:MAG: hypothetical protein AAF411_25285, partial [Myxococcota bacterium]
ARLVAARGGFVFVFFCLAWAPCVVGGYAFAAAPNAAADEMAEQLNDMLEANDDPFGDADEANDDDAEEPAEEDEAAGSDEVEETAE